MWIVTLNDSETDEDVAVIASDFNELQEILEYVASAIQGNIRELEGSLNAVICQYRLKNRPLSLAEVKNLIKNNKNILCVLIRS